MFGLIHDSIGNPTASDLQFFLGLVPNLEQLHDVRFTRDLGLGDCGKELDHARTDVVDQ